MSEKLEGHLPSQEQYDKKNELQQDIVKAETIIWSHCGERTMGQKVDFSPEELTAVARVWDELDSKIQNLTLSAFPEIAANILTIEISEKRAEEEEEKV